MRYLSWPEQAPAGAAVSVIEQRVTCIHGKTAVINY
jgi:hypothetical protein